ncbi:helix-turn-helix domain-containing protein [Paenibacillus timonensis]|uniref:helix-turn-helix domain-containing protein n=1 Tax=Paenibacillus timonensis TaxID=225915 RepID=UPI003F9AF70B
MTNEPTIRSVISRQLERKGYSLHSFSHRSGINRGTLSAILNGNPPKPISIGQLDLITEALEQPIGRYYPLYIEECIDSGHPNRRRLKSFMLRCAEVGELACIEQVLSRLAEDLSYLPMIFAIGEELYEEGRREAARLFYQSVCEYEKYQHSERLAISQYRLFRMNLGDDAESNLRSATWFEPYRNRLPEDLQLDGLLHLANAYYTLQKWSFVVRFAEELQTLARRIYETSRKTASANSYHELHCERHLVVYYGQGYLLKGSALEHQGRYGEALACVAEYADLSWFEGLNETGWREVGKFKVWARANRYNLEILNGNEAILPEYIDFLKEHPYEVLPSLRIIVEAANLNGFRIDDVLKEFPVNTDLYNQFPNYYVSAVNKDRYLDLNYQLALYLLREQRIAEGLEKLIYALKYAVAQKNKEFFMKMVPLFEQYRSLVSSEQLKEYEILMGEVLKGAEMDLGTHADH